MENEKTKGAGALGCPAEGFSGLDWAQRFLDKLAAFDLPGGDFIIRAPTPPFSGSTGAAPRCAMACQGIAIQGASQ